MLHNILLRIFSPSNAKTASPQVCTANAPKRCDLVYSLKSYRLRVDTVQRYRRPNYDGSIWFEGTQLALTNAYEGAKVDLSFEDLYDFAAPRDIIDVVMAPYELPPINYSSLLPVAVINRARSGFHLLPGDIEKCSVTNKGGTARLTMDIQEYCSRELNVTFK